MRAWHLLVIGALVVAGFAYVGGFVDRRAEDAGSGITSLAIGVPARATAARVQSDLRAASAAAEAYRTEHGGYEGMTIAGLRAYDASVSRDLQLERADSAAYCIAESAATAASAATYSVHGAAGTVSIARGGC